MLDKRKPLHLTVHRHTSYDIYMAEWVAFCAACLKSRVRILVPPLTVLKMIDDDDD